MHKLNQMKLRLVLGLFVTSDQEIQCAYSRTPRARMWAMQSIHHVSKNSSS